MVSAASKKFHRNFIIFSNEDSGYEEGNKPSGHLKIEVRDRRQRLSAVIQNLRNGNGRFGYALYLVRMREGAVEYVRAGEIRPSGGRAELELVFDQGYVDGTVYTVDDFDTFAVLVETDNRAGIGVTCPLAAYRNGRTDWRGGLRKALQKKLETDQLQTENQMPDKAGLHKAEYMPHFELSEQSGPENGSWPKPGAELYSGTEPNVQPVTDETGSEAELFEIKPGETGNDMETNALPMADKTSGEEELYKQPELLLESGGAEMDDQAVASDYSYTDAVQPEAINNIDQGYQDVSASDPKAGQVDPYAKTVAQPAENDAEKYNQQVQQPPGIEYKYPGSTGNFNMECVYLNGNICGALLNTANTSEPCSSCSINKREAPIPMESQTEGNLNGLEDELERSFDICDPFHSRRSDYIWWRVTNPVNLNNMFYQNNIKSPLMFNPAVMMAHYKYKHLIIGVFTHKTGQRYLICGVPGMYMVDPSPFGEVCRWVQAEGNRQRYGAFGYWLLYIDPKDSRVIKF